MIVLGKSISFSVGLIVIILLRRWLKHRIFIFYVLFLWIVARLWWFVFLVMLLLLLMCLEIVIGKILTRCTHSSFGYGYLLLNFRGVLLPHQSLQFLIVIFSDLLLISHDILIKRSGSQRTFWFSIRTVNLLVYLLISMMFFPIFILMVLFVTASRSIILINDNNIRCSFNCCVSCLSLWHMRGSSFRS